MYSYVNESPYNTLEDNGYIISFQSGQSIGPNNIYWVSESGVARLNIHNSGVFQIMGGDSHTALSSHIAYNPIDDYIYYGIEDGNTYYTKRVDVNGNRQYNLGSSVGPGLSFNKRYNTIMSMTKDGTFKTLTNELTPGTITSLGGRETLNRRTRFDEDNGYIYALKTDATSYLTRLYRYDTSAGSWSFLKILSYGLFGGAFDIDFDEQQIYYTATSDYFTPSYYGVMREAINSGNVDRIAQPSGLSYFQTKELIFDNHNNKLYYVAEDFSGSNESYNLIKTDASGNNPETVISVPSHSGIKAMTLDGGLYRSSIDFQLTDFNNSFGLNSLSSYQVGNAFVSIRGQNNNKYSYIRAKVLTQDKQNVIWNATYSDNGPYLQESGIFVQDIGHTYDTINANYNTANDWNNAVLRLEVAGHPSGNNETTRIYSANLTVYTSNAQTVSSESGLPMSMTGHGTSTSGIPLFTLAGTSFDSFPLYTLANSGETLDFPMYVDGHIQSSGFFPMYMFGQVPSSTFPLYIGGHVPVSSSLPMYIGGVYTETGSLPLFLSSKDYSVSSGSIPFYMYSSTNSGIYKTFPLFLNADTSGTSPGASMILYMESNIGVTRSATMPLYLRSETPVINKGFPCFVGNYYNSSSSGISMYISGPSGTDGALLASGGIPLFMGRQYDMTWNSIPLYLHVGEESTNYIPMYVSGSYQSYNNFPMYVSGISPETKTMTLYTHGF